MAQKNLWTTDGINLVMHHLSLLVYLPRHNRLGNRIWMRMHQRALGYSQEMKNSQTDLQQACHWSLSHWTCQHHRNDLSNMGSHPNGCSYRTRMMRFSLVLTTTSRPYEMGCTAWWITDPATALERHLVSKESAKPVYRDAHAGRHFSSPSQHIVSTTTCHTVTRADTSKHPELESWTPRKPFANLPIPPGPTPLWGPGCVPGEWADVCWFIKPPGSEKEWHIRMHGAFTIPFDTLGIKRTDLSCHHEVWITSSTSIHDWSIAYPRVPNLADQFRGRGRTITVKKGGTIRPEINSNDFGGFWN